MGADVRALKNRIKSIDSTLHLTKAMGLVASSKMKKAQSGMKKAREYEASFHNVVSALLSNPEALRGELFSGNGSDAVRLIVIAGDRGLAGGYNANVFRLLKAFSGVEVYAIGKRACDKLNKPTLYAEKFSYEDAKRLAVELLSDFADKKFGKLGIVCTEYHSMLSQETKVKWVLPFEVSTGNKPVGIVFEPDEKTVLDAVIPQYLASVIISSVRESFACEISARRTAMDSAGKNAKQMIDDLSLEYNRARQGAITQEITEIVAGSNF